MRQREAAADEERRRKAATVREALSRKVLLITAVCSDGLQQGTRP